MKNLHISNRRTVLKTISAGAIATSVAAPAFAQSRKEWRIQSGYAANSAAFNDLKFFGDSVSAASNGALKIEILPSGQGAVAAGLDLVDAVASGSVEAGHALTGGLERKLPGSFMLQGIAFGLASFEHNAWLEIGGGQELGDKVFDQAGLKFLPLGEADTQMFGWFKKELKSSEDLRGVKIRMGDSGFAVLKAFGADPKNIANGVPTYTAFSKGEIEAAEAAAPAGDLANKLYEFAQNYYFPNWNEPSLLSSLFINRAAWNGLSAEMKNIMTMAAKVSTQRIMYRAGIENDNALRTLASQHGVRLLPTPVSILEELKKTCREVMPTLAKDQLSKAIYESNMEFAAKIGTWSRVAYPGYLSVRS